MPSSVKFVFEESSAIALPKMLEILRGHLRCDDARITEASLTSMTLEDNGLWLRLSTEWIAEETIVTVALELDGNDTPLARLAQLSYAFVSEAAASAVIWAGTDVRIPRIAFIAGLKRSFEQDAQPAAPVLHINPRRVSVPSALRPRPARPAARSTDARFDAHVIAFETHLRGTFRRDATRGEIAELRADVQPIKTRVNALASNASTAMQSPELRAASLVTTVTTLMLSTGAANII